MTLVCARNVQSLCAAYIAEARASAAFHAYNQGTAAWCYVARANSRLCDQAAEPNRRTNGNGSRAVATIGRAHLLTTTGEGQTAVVEVSMALLEV